MTKDELKARMEEVDFRSLLREAVEKPGTISKAFSTFHNYSIGNRMLILFQCALLGIEPGPMAGYRQWQKLNRQVQAESRKLYLWVPLMRTGYRENEETGEKESYRYLSGFDLQPAVFVMSQTEGEDVAFDAPPDFDIARALEHLDITEVSFDLTDGNIGGYAKEGEVAINPLGDHQFRTWVHEVAHTLLHTNGNGKDQNRKTCEFEAEAVSFIVGESLDLPGAEQSRGYIQNWWGEGKDIPETSARRIFGTANKILEAGLIETKKEG